MVERARAKWETNPGIPRTRDPLPRPGVSPVVRRCGAGRDRRGRGGPAATGDAEAVLNEQQREAKTVGAGRLTADTQGRPQQQSRQPPLLIYACGPFLLPEKLSGVL